MEVRHSLPMPPGVDVPDEGHASARGLVLSVVGLRLRSRIHAWSRSVGSMSQ